VKPTRPKKRQPRAEKERNSGEAGRFKASMSFTARGQLFLIMCLDLSFHCYLTARTREWKLSFRVL